MITLYLCTIQSSGSDDTEEATRVHCHRGCHETEINVREITGGMIISQRDPQRNKLRRHPHSRDAVEQTTCFYDHESQTLAHPLKPISLSGSDI